MPETDGLVLPKEANTGRANMVMFQGLKERYWKRGSLDKEKCLPLD